MFIVHYADKMHNLWLSEIWVYMNNQNRQRAASLQLNIDSRLNEILTYKRIYCVSSESQGRLSLGNKNTKYELTSGSVAEAPAAFFSFFIKLHSGYTWTEPSNEQQMNQITSFPFHQFKAFSLTSTLVPVFIW